MAKFHSFLWLNSVIFGASLVKNLCAMPETWVGKIPWRKAWQPTPIFLPGVFPWTEEPGGLQSLVSQRVGHDWATNHSTAHSITFFTHTHTPHYTTPHHVFFIHLYVGRYLGCIHILAIINNATVFSMSLFIMDYN